VKKILIGINLSFIVLLFNACCKSNKCKCEKEWGEKVEDCTPIHYGPYPLGEVKDYFYFKLGSYWVYKFDLTDELDSIFTISCDTTVIEISGRYQLWKSITYTTLSTQLRSEIYNSDYKFFRFEVYLEVTNFTYGQAQRLSMVKDNSSSGTAMVFKLPFKTFNDSSYWFLSGVDIS
jgi:hypothetical protein